jgi:hypothetical protein
MTISTSAAKRNSRRSRLWLTAFAAVAFAGGGAIWLLSHNKPEAAEAGLTSHDALGQPKGDTEPGGASGQATANAKSSLPPANTAANGWAADMEHPRVFSGELRDKWTDRLGEFEILDATELKIGENSPDVQVAPVYQQTYLLRTGMKYPLVRLPLFLV